MTISSAVPSEAAQRQADQGQRPIAPFMQSARDEILWRLYAGKAVRRVTMSDIFDGLLNDEAKYREAVNLLESVAVAEDASRLFELQEKAKQMIEAYVDARPDWIEERAAEMAAEDE